VCALGDLLLDVIVRLGQPLAPGADATAVTRLGAGGQAANVAAWVVELGGESRFIGKRATDGAGRFAVDELERRGVEVVGPAVEGRNGVVVSLVEPGGERTMASDRGVAPALVPEELEAAWLDGCDWLHLAGYSLLAEPVGAAATEAAALARRAGGQVSVDLSSWSAMRDFGPARFLERLRRLEPAVVFANEQERLALGAELPAPTRVVKRGAAGCRIETPGEVLELPSQAREVVDSTGAGDALAAGFLLGGPLRAAAERGLGAAGRCVGRMGAMP